MGVSPMTVSPIKIQHRPESASIKCTFIKMLIKKEEENIGFMNI